MAMKNEKELIEEIKEHLDQGINELDSDILLKIRKARVKALEQKKTWWILRSIPVGWVAAAILVMVVAANLFTVNDNKQISSLTKKADKNQVTPEKKVLSEQTVIAENKPNEKIEIVPEIRPDQVALIEILSDEKELELYENMEFYSWMVEDTSSSG
jgi:hypothetical protein